MIFRRIFFFFFFLYSVSFGCLSFSGLTFFSSSSPLFAQVSRLRDTLSGLRKQIDSEKGMQERILREFRASFGDNGSGSNSSVRRSGSLAQAVANNRPSSGSRRSHEKY